MLVLAARHGFIPLVRNDHFGQFFRSVFNQLDVGFFFLLFALCCVPCSVLNRFHFDFLKSISGPNQFGMSVSTHSNDFQLPLLVSSLPV